MKFDSIRKLSWFRRTLFGTAACIIALVGACAYFRLQRPADLGAYAGMAAECHPVWKDFAFRRFGISDSTASLLSKYPPSRREEFGRYGIYHFQKDEVTNGIPFSGFTVISKDGKLIGAEAGSCTWEFVFFSTPDPQLDREHAAYWQERREKLRQFREQRQKQ